MVAEAHGRNLVYFNNLSASLMRIAFFLPVIAGRGGIETVVSSLAEELRANGDEPRVFIFGGSREKEWLSSLPWAREFGSPSQPHAVRLAAYALGALGGLARWRPDAIVCTHPLTLLLARRCCRILRLKAPVIAWLHGPINMFEDIERALAASDGAICICEERAAEIRQALAGMAGLRRPVRVAHNGGTVHRRFTVGRPDVPTFVYMGRLTYLGQKRVSDILSAVARVRGNFRLRIIGDGDAEDKRELHRLAEGLGIGDRVEWIGWHATPWACVRAATALILASSFEGFPMVCVEALLLGVPIVCSAYAGAKEYILPGRTGWTFPTGDIAALTNCLQSIVDGKSLVPAPETVREFGSAFSIEAMTSTFRSALREMAALR